MGEMQAALAATPEDASAQWSKLYRDDAEFRTEFDRDPRAAMSAQVAPSCRTMSASWCTAKTPARFTSPVPAEGAAEVSGRRP